MTDMKYLTKDFVSSATDVPMKARLVRPGEGYGAWNGEYQKKNDSKELLIIFYDRELDTGCPMKAKIISSYYLSTLMEGGLPKQRGLNLDGGVKKWAIGAKEYTEVLEWAERLRQKIGVEKGKPLDFSRHLEP